MVLSDDTDPRLRVEPVERQVFRVKLAQLADQTDPQVIRRTLLEALDETIDMSVNRVREANNGRIWSDPDHANVVRAVELAGRITGAIGVDPSVLISFRNETEKLVKRAATVLREREKDKLALVAPGTSKK